MTEIIASFNLKYINVFRDQCSRFLIEHNSVNEDRTALKPTPARLANINCVIIGNVNKNRLIINTFSEKGG